MTKLRTHIYTGPALQAWNNLGPGALIKIHVEIHVSYQEFSSIPYSKFHGANMGPIWGRQNPGGPHVGLMNFAIWEGLWLAGGCAASQSDARFENRC